MVRPSVGPLTQAGLDEALGLAIGARRIGSRVVMTEAELGTGRGKVVTAVSLAVVGVDTLDAHAEAGVVGHRRAQEHDAAVRVLGRQDLGIGDARGVIDRDVQVIPADVGASAMPLSVAGDAMPDLDDPA